MALLTIAGQYGEELRTLGISPSDTPSLAPITFNPKVSWGPSNIACKLQAHGITKDEVLNAHDFAFSWLTKVVATEMDNNIHEFIKSTLASLHAVATCTTLRI
jgi:hypothetical protein